jgi:hypothetical protein
MSKDTSTDAGALRMAAQDLLRFLTGPELAESDLFPYGITRISFTMRAGDAELQLEVEGPDHPHDHDHDDEDEEDWLIDRGDGLPELDDDDDL